MQENKSRKVLWLIDELVYWVKGTNTNFQIIRQECHLGKLIEQIFEIYEDELKEKNLRYALKNANIHARIDQGLFVIVTRNLIFNAVIHSKSYTEIEVNIEVQKEHYQVVVMNEFDKNQTQSDRGLGVGMTLLLPILKKVNFKIDSVKNENIFTSKLLMK